jgi:hypothetical protein
VTGGTWVSASWKASLRESAVLFSFLWPGLCLSRPTGTRN